jgi:flagellar assembly protein FliH
MASSFDATDAAAQAFAQRLERHERVPRVEAHEGAARSSGSSYARFIPREEIRRAVAWVPDSLEVRGTRGAPNPASTPDPAPAPPPIDPAAQRAARLGQLQARLAEVFEQGRQMGREETTQTLHAEAAAAMAAFRQQQASEVGAPVAALLAQFQQGLDGVEQALARRLAGIAMQMARQVVRSELQTSAALVVDVVQEALAEVLLSARHITVNVHPEDLALITHGCADACEARGARLVADGHIERGGCLVVSDLGVVDARLATRWAGAVAAMGHPVLAEVDVTDRPAAP